MSNYRAVHLGGDKWAVRRFVNGTCDETQLIFHVFDPELRSSEKQVIDEAIARNKWTHISNE